MRRLAVREEGSTLAAILAVMMTVMVVAVGAIQASMHANDVTSVDRERLQAVHGAEAGVSTAMERLESDASCDSSVSAPVSLTDQDKTLSSYQTMVEPEAGILTCPTDPNDPAYSLVRVIRAWGHAPTGSGRTLRQLEVTVKLVPQDGFRFALFAAGPSGIVTVKNTGTIQGDVYAESLDQTQNNINAWDVITPGSIDTKDNAVYSGTLWAGGNIHLNQNGNVTESIIAAGSSAAGDITLENNTVVGRDVRARHQITYQGNQTIGGSAIQEDPNVPPPPTLNKPTFTWDPNNYTPAPATFATADELSTSLVTNKTSLQGTYYTAESTGTISLPKNVKVTGPLTIVTNGCIDIGGTSFAESGGPWQVVIVALSSTDCGANAPIDVTKAASFAPGLDVLLYTNGKVDIKNNLTMTGAIYADTIALKNSATVSQSQSLADNPPAGFDFTLASAAQFVVVPVLWREIAPGNPPPG